MNNKIMRIVIGVIWLVGGVITSVNGNMEWWFSMLFFLSVCYLYIQPSKIITESRSCIE